MHIGIIQWIIVILAALLVGFAKTGVPNVGIFTITLMIMIFPAKQSVGIILPMLITGDIIAVTYYRRTVVWKHLISLIPWVLTGIILGYFVLDSIQSNQLKVMIGILVLGLVALHLVSERLGEKVYACYIQSAWFTIFLGLLAGFTTMIGNAAGGVMAIYFLSKKLPKNEFVGTGAWFYLIVNIIKIPFNVQLGLITAHTLVLNAWMVPFIIIGTIVGIKVLPQISQKVFQTVVLLLSIIGALDLII